MLTNITENKQQMVHIIAEIVAMVAMVFYFNQKHKKVLTIVEDLSQRIEEQEELIQKHEEVIKKLVEGFNNTQKVQPMTQQPMTQQPMTQQPMTQQSSMEIQKTMQAEPKEYIVSEDLDKELANELLELEEPSDIIEVDTSDLGKNEDLKKDQ